MSNPSVAATGSHTLETIGARLDRLPVVNWHYIILWSLGLGVLCDMMDLYISGPVLAELIHQGWSNNNLNATFNSLTMMGMLIGSLISGVLGDHFGRRMAFLINVCVYTAATIVGGLSPNMTILIGSRFVMGLGLGAALPASYGSLSEYIPVKERGRFSSWIALIANVSAPITTFSAMLLIPQFGWRSMFFVVGFIGLVVFYMQLRYMPESPRWLAGRGRVEEADAIVSRLEALVEKRTGVKPPPVALADKPAAIKNVPYSALFKGKMLRRFAVVSSGLVAMNVGVYTFTGWVPTIFVQRGMDVKSSLFLSTLMFLGVPTGIFVLGLFANKINRVRGMAFFLLLTGILGYVYSLQTDTVLMVIMGFLTMCALYVFSILTCSIYMSEVFPTQARLRSAGTANAIGRIGSICIHPAIAFVLTRYGQTGVFFMVLTILAVIAVFIFLAGVETRGKTLEQISEGVLDHVK